MWKLLLGVLLNMSRRLIIASQTINSHEATLQETSTQISRHIINLHPLKRKLHHLLFEILSDIELIVKNPHPVSTLENLMCFDH